MLEHSDCRQSQVSSQASSQDVPYDVQVDEPVSNFLGDAIHLGSQPVLGEGYNVLQVQRSGFHMLGRLHKTMDSPVV